MNEQTDWPNGKARSISIAQKRLAEGLPGLRLFMAKTVKIELSKRIELDFDYRTFAL